MKLRRNKQLANKRQRRSPKICILNHNGRLQILGLGVWYYYWRDPYHLLLTIPWSGFIALIFSFYVIINTLFALAYLIGPNNIENARPGSFADAFFFSVQTLASIGYGAMYPRSVYANIIVTIEAMIGLIGLAVMTGLAFARFAQPTARVLFSKTAVITPYEGIPTLMFRTANQRRNQILEAQLRVSFMRDEISSEGYSMRRLYELKLIRNWTPSFSLSWMIMHPIDQSSPLYGVTQESLIQSKAMLIVSLSGLDETVSQMIHARNSYAAQDILCNYRFVDIFHDTPDGHRYLDYTHFHDTIPLSELESYH